MVLSLAALLLFGCSDEAVSPLESPSAVRATLTLALGSASTRADTTTVAGTDYENYIDPTRITVCIFSASDTTDADATFSQQFVADDLIQLDADRQLYYLTGRLASAPTPPFKVVVLANWGTLTAPALVAGQTTIDDLALRSGLFLCEQPFAPSASTPIPMYGVRSYEAFPLVEGQNADLGTVRLTRALAKIVVTTHDASLADVRLTRYHNLGLSAPYGICGQTTYSTDANLNIPSDRVALTFPSGYTLQSLTDLPLVEQTADDGERRFEVYVPEYRNTGSYASDRVNGGEVTPAQITFTIQGQTRTLDFKDYATDRPFNIYRNYRYEYHVERALIRYQVLPMDTLTAGDIRFD